MDFRLTLRQAAQELGVSVPTLRRWLRSGRLRGNRREGRFGEEWTVAVEEVERLREPSQIAVGAAYWQGRFEQLQGELEGLRAQLRRSQEALESERRARQRREEQLRQVIEHAENLEDSVRRLEQERRSRLVSAPGTPACGCTQGEAPRARVGERGRENWFRVVTGWLRADRWRRKA